MRHELLISLFLHGTLLDRMNRLEDAAGHYLEALRIAARLPEGLRGTIRNPIVTIRDAYLNVCRRMGTPPEDCLLEGIPPSGQTVPSRETFS